MAWIDFQQILTDELKATRFVPPALDVAQDTDEAMRMILATEQLTRAELREAIRERARTGKWPDLNQDAQCLLHERLLWGCYVLSILSTPGIEWLLPTPQGKGEGSKTLEWLLADTWETQGWSWWEARLRKAPPASS